MQIKKSLGLFFVSGCFALTVFAAEPVAKEDMTPPPPEGALTADQIPPIHTLPKPITKTPQQLGAPGPTAPATTDTNGPSLTRPTEDTNPPTLNTPIPNPPNLPSQQQAPTDQVIPVQ